MKKYQYILFDLDGTITDSAIGIIHSVQYALKALSAPVPEEEALYTFVGPPLHESFERFCGFSKEKALKAVEHYRVYYREKGIFENTVYEGVRPLLEKLCKRGKKLFIATSKPEVFARQIIDYFDLSSYFDYVGGSLLSGERVHKDEVIAYTLEKAGIQDFSQVLMVGDRAHDVLGAQKWGIDVVGVRYGYGGGAELEKAGATYLVRDIGEIDLIIQ